MIFRQVYRNTLAAEQSPKMGTSSLTTYLAISDEKGAS